MQLFGSLYVQSGDIDRELGRQFNTALRLRNLARYRYDATVSRQDAEAVLGLARQLLARLEYLAGP